MESSLRWDAVISIHALHEESDDCDSFPNDDFIISIHALHEESECASHIRFLHLPISIHALHEESDLLGATLELTFKFQSTLSMRRAKSVIACDIAHVQFQSTLSMRRATG